MVAELRELAGEGLVALGGALGGAFAPLFAEILPRLLAALVRIGAGWGGAGPRPGSRVTRPPSPFPSPPPPQGRRRSVGERSWAAATLGEAGAALGGAVAPFLPRLGPALGASATRDPHPEVRSNALFAMGRLAEAAGPALDAYPTNGGLPRPGAPALLSHALPPPAPPTPAPPLSLGPPGLRPQPLSHAPRGS